MLFRRLTLFAAAAFAVVLSACATGPKPEAFVAEACMEATAAESLAEHSMQRQEQLASQLEEHQARLVEMQRMRSRIVTGRMSDEELSQWEPELLPWEEPAPEPEPVDTVVAEPEMSESMSDTTEMVAESDSMMTAADSDTLGGFDSYDAAEDTIGTDAMSDEMEAGSDTTGMGTSIDEPVEGGMDDPGESMDESEQSTGEAPADTGTEASTEPVDSGEAEMSGDGEQAPEEQSGDTGAGTDEQPASDTGEEAP